MQLIEPFFVVPAQQKQQAGTRRGTSRERNMPPPSARYAKPKMKSLNLESNGLCASGPNTSGIKQIKYVGYCPQMSRVQNRPPEHH
jgi:hypothetical protein